MKSTKMLSLLIMAVFLTMTGITPVGATQYVSITQIRDETQGGWHQTYEAHGRSIQVDTEIDVPDVQSVPVLWASSYANIQPPQNTLQFDNEVPPTGIYINTRGPQHEVNVSSDVKFGWRLLGENEQAESSPFSYEDAQTYARSLFDPLIEQTPDVELKQVALFPYSRCYVDEAERKDPEQRLDISKPLTPMGHYDGCYRQLLHDIPYLSSGGAFLDSDDALYRPTGEINILLYDSSSYIINYYPVKEDGVLADDVPLLSFSDVLPAFESFIEDGLARNIRRVEFGYMLFDDDSGQGFILKPVWLMACSVYDSAKQDDVPVIPDLAVVLDATASSGIIVDAQTGETYTLKDVPRGRSTLPSGRILTWDDV